VDFTVLYFVLTVLVKLVPSFVDTYVAKMFGFEIDWI